MNFLSNEYKDWEADRIEEEKLIVAKYPFLQVRDIDGTPDMNAKFPLMSLEIPNGWSLLFAQMCDDLKEVLIEEGCLDTFYFIQIKEKYNQLRCYAGYPTTNKILRVLQKYEHLSLFVCTKCGKPATKEITTEYIESICNDCWHNKYQQSTFIDIELELEFYINTFGRNTGIVTTLVNVDDEWNRYLKKIEEK